VLSENSKIDKRNFQSISLKFTALQKKSLTKVGFGESRRITNPTQERRPRMNISTVYQNPHPRVLSPRVMNVHNSSTSPRYRGDHNDVYTQKSTATHDIYQSNLFEETDPDCDPGKQSSSLHTMICQNTSTCNYRETHIAQPAGKANCPLADALLGEPAPHQPSLAFGAHEDVSGSCV
jgi:hypothetical protein